MRAWFDTTHAVITLHCKIASRDHARNRHLLATVVKQINLLGAASGTQHLITKGNRGRRDGSECSQQAGVD